MLSHEEMSDFFKGYRAVMQQFVAETEARIDLLRTVSPQYNPTQRAPIDRLGNYIGSLIEGFSDAARELAYGSDFGSDDYDFSVRRPYFDIKLDRDRHEQLTGRPASLKLIGHNFHPFEYCRLTLSLDDATGHVQLSSSGPARLHLVTHPDQLRPLLDKWFSVAGHDYAPVAPVPVRQPGRT